jgi:hypothetical protein
LIQDGPEDETKRALEYKRAHSIYQHSIIREYFPIEQRVDNEE